MSWTGADYAAVIAASGAFLVSVGAFVVSAWNGRAIKTNTEMTNATHDLVNSRMTEFMAKLEAAGLISIKAAEAEGALRGQLAERMAQAEKAAAVVENAPVVSGDVSGTIKGKIIS